MSSPVPAFASGGNAEAPSTAPVTPTIDINTLLSASVAPIATQAAQQVVATALPALEARLSQLENAAVPALEQAGESVLTRVVTDVWLERLLAVIAFGGALAFGLVILIGYMNGNHQAADLLGLAGSAAVPLVAYILKVVLSPKANVPVGTTPTIQAQAGQTATVTATAKA